jgi:hypothetical protein
MDKTENLGSIHLCTLFDSSFLAQGVTLIESVEAYASGRIHWTILALDSTASTELRNLVKPNVSVIPFEEFPDEDLKSLVGIRPWREICWTSAACLLSYCLKSQDDYAFVGYVDADCFFVGNIFDMLAEIPSEKSFAIHEHNFSVDRLEWLQKSGRFNVGVVAGRPKTDFADCIKVWREQVLLRCDVDMAEGRCGDQTYLNDWPSRYQSLYVYENPGVGLAPWNLNNYRIDSMNHNLYIGEKRVYFYHFHGLQFRLFGNVIAIYVPAAGYQILNLPIKEIYKPYVSRLLSHSVEMGLPARQFKLRKDFSWTVKNTLKGLIRATSIYAKVHSRY